MEALCDSGKHQQQYGKNFLHKVWRFHRKNLFLCFRNTFADCNCFVIASHLWGEAISQLISLIYFFCKIASSFHSPRSRSTHLIRKYSHLYHRRNFFIENMIDGIGNWHVNLILLVDFMYALHSIISLRHHVHFCLCGFN